MTYITSPYSFSYPYETHSSYPTTNYDSSSSQPSQLYSSVPLITVNTGGPFQRNSEDQNSKEISGNQNIQETRSNANDLSSNQKREVTNTQLRNDKQKETAEGLQVEKESGIKQMIPKTDADEILKQKEE